MASGIWDEGPTVIVALHTPLSPKDEDWRRYVDLVAAAAKEHSFISLLTLSDGGDASWSQRTELERALPKRMVKRVMLTDVATLRAAVRMRRAPVGAFEPTRFADAISQLDVSDHRIASLIDFAVSLQRDVMPIRVLRDVYHALRDQRAPSAATRPLLGTAS